MADRAAKPDVWEDGPAPAGRQFTETEVAHGRLRRAILRGELAAGALIRQGELAAAFGVGRTPLREALRLLEREGLVEAEPQRRARVAEFSVGDLEQLYANRIQLETLAIRYAVPRLVGEELGSLEQNLALMERSAAAEDYEGWQAPHRAFHSGLVAPAGGRLLKMIAQLSDHAERYRHAYTVETPRGWASGIPEHRAVLDAVLMRDPDAAAARLARHYGTVSLGLIAFMAPEHEPALLRTALRSAMRRDDADGAGSV